MAPLGKLIVAAGIILVVIGLLLWIEPKVPLLGKLPGDVYYKGKGVRIFFPLATCVILSIVISVIWYLLGRK